MDIENRTILEQMLQDMKSGHINDETSIPLIAEEISPSEIDPDAPGDVIEVDGEFDFEGYQVVRREFFAHTFEPSQK